MPSSHDVRRGVAATVATLGLVLGPQIFSAETADAASTNCTKSQNNLYIVCGTYASKAACESARKARPAYRTRYGEWRLSCMQIRGSQGPWSLASQLI
jgi:hypothetical protein